MKKEETAIQLELPLEIKIQAALDSEFACPRCGEVLKKVGCWICESCGYSSCGVD